MKEVAIIGGGLLGLAIGYQMSILKLNYRVSVFEKENSIGKHQSGNNSGVLHCGLYYKPGSLKAQLAVNGIGEMISFCESNKINYDVCGKVVVASDKEEAKLLENLANRGFKNGFCRSTLNNTSLIHYQDSICNFRNQSQIVTYKNHAHFAFFLQGF